MALPLASALQQASWGEFDLVQAGDLFPQGLIALSLKHLMGIPYVAFCHGEEVTITDRYRYHALLRDRIYFGADVVIGASDFAQCQLMRIGVPTERIRVIKPGVDWERFCPRPPSPELSRRFSLGDKRVLLTVSRLSPRKGHDLAIRAVAKIISEIPNLHYLIVGKGPEEIRLRELAGELGVTSHVSFVGYVPEEELSAYYNACDIFVMPNREENGDIEGFGIVFLEANAAGKPVVGGRSGGTYDSVLDRITGFLIDPNSVEELTATLRELLNSQCLRQQLGSAGLLRVRNEFSWSAGARRLREISNEVVAGRLSGFPSVASISRYPPPA
jgi:phosphatidylinositol alpha-1,6-mannosyltransferase